MTASQSMVSRTLFQRHDYLMDAWAGVIVSAGSALAAGLIVKSLIVGGFAGWSHVWPLVVLPIIAVYLINMSVMFAFAAVSCDPKGYGDSVPWMRGLFGTKRAKPSFWEQSLSWATTKGRDKLTLIANS